MADDYGIFGQDTGSIQQDLDWLMYGAGGAFWLDSLSADSSVEEPCSTKVAPVLSDLGELDGTYQSELPLEDLQVSQSKKIGFWDELSLIGVARAEGNVVLDDLICRDLPDAAALYGAGEVSAQDSVWRRMSTLNQSASTRALDADRTYWTQWSTAAKYMSQGLAIDEMGRNGASPVFGGLSIAAYAADMTTKFIDAGYDEAQFMALSDQCSMISSEECERQRAYVIHDQHAAVSGALTATMRLASDLSAKAAPVLSNSLSYVSIFTDLYALAMSLTSALPVLCEQVVLPPNERDDAKLARIIKLLGSTTPVAVTALYRIFGVAAVDVVSGARVLTASDVAKLLRNVALSGEKANYLKNSTVAGAIGKASIGIMVALALVVYVPAIVEAYEEGEDDRMAANVIGLSAVLATNAGVVMMRSIPGLGLYGSLLLTSGVMLTAYQVHFVENGGSGRYSVQYAKTDMVSHRFLQVLAEKRRQRGLRDFNKDGQTNLEAWRNMLILAGLDDKSHGVSILSDPSIVVPTRAGNIYNRAFAPDSDCEELLQTIYAESALFDPNLSSDFVPSKKTLWDDVLEGIGSGVLCGSTQNLDCMAKADVEGPFLEDGSLAQAAYLVFLKQSGVLTEEYWGDMWDDPRLVVMRKRLAEPDAVLLEREVFNYDPETPELLVFLRMHRQDSWQDNPAEMEALLADMQDNLGMSGVAVSLDTMQKQLQVLHREFQNPDDTGLTSQEEQLLLAEVFSDTRRELAAL